MVERLQSGLASTEKDVKEEASTQGKMRYTLSKTLEHIPFLDFEKNQKSIQRSFLITYWGKIT